MFWIYESYVVDFQQMYSDVGMKFYLENGMWEVFGFEVLVVYYINYCSIYVVLKYFIKLKW